MNPPQNNRHYYNGVLYLPFCTYCGVCLDDNGTAYIGNNAYNFTNIEDCKRVVSQLKERYELEQGFIHEYNNGKYITVYEY